MVNALIVGVVTGLLAWWLISRLPVPRLGISAVARIPNQARAGAWLYRVKIVSLARRPLPERPAIDVRVVATVKIRGLRAAEPKKWNNFDVPLVNGGRVPMLDDNTIVTLHTEKIDLAGRPLLRSALGSEDPKDLDLERMLRLGNEAELRLLVTASDPYTHATTTRIANRDADGILSGPFRDAPGRKGLEVVPADEPPEAEPESVALLLIGAPGAGKSSVLDALSTLLEVDAIAHGAIESEQLARGAPLLGADVWTAQLAAVLAIQCEAGRRLFLIAATTETKAQLAALRATGAQRSLTVCLQATAELVAERLDRREPDRWPGKSGLIAHARKLAVSIPTLDGIDVSIDTEGRGPEDVAALVLEELRTRGLLG